MIDVYSLPNLELGVCLHLLEMQQKSLEDFVEGRVKIFARNMGITPTQCLVTLRKLHAKKAFKVVGEGKRPNFESKKGFKLKLDSSFVHGLNFQAFSLGAPLLALYARLKGLAQAGLVEKGKKELGTALNERPYFVRVGLGCLERLGWVSTVFSGGLKKGSSKKEGFMSGQIRILQVHNSPLFKISNNENSVHGKVCTCKICEISFFRRNLEGQRLRNKVSNPKRKNSKSIANCNTSEFNNTSCWDCGNKDKSNKLPLANLSDKAERSKSKNILTVSEKPRILPFINSGARLRLLSRVQRLLGFREQGSGTSGYRASIGDYCGLKMTKTEWLVSEIALRYKLDLNLDNCIHVGEIDADPEVREATDESEFFLRTLVGFYFRHGFLTGRQKACGIHTMSLNWKEIQSHIHTQCDFIEFPEFKGGVPMGEVKCGRAKVWPEVNYVSDEDWEKIKEKYIIPEVKGPKVAEWMDQATVQLVQEVQAVLDQAETFPAIVQDPFYITRKAFIQSLFEFFSTYRFLSVKQIFRLQATIYAVGCQIDVATDGGPISPVTWRHFDGSRWNDHPQAEGIKAPDPQPISDSQVIADDWGQEIQ